MAARESPASLEFSEDHGEVFGVGRRAVTADDATLSFERLQGGAPDVPGHPGRQEHPGRLHADARREPFVRAATIRRP